MSDSRYRADDGATLRRIVEVVQRLLVGLALLLAGMVVGAVPAAAQNAFGVSTPVMINTVGAATGIGAGQRLGESLPQLGIVVATAVAAEDGPMLYRGMRGAADGSPELGNSAKTLGARPGIDIPVDEGGHGAPRYRWHVRQRLADRDA